MKDKMTRKSKGVAFLLFDSPESAISCVRNTDGCKMFDRTLKSNIAKDNGRTTEFIRRKNYPDKSRCYECGDFGHLSYVCSKNLLGERQPVLKKKKVKKSNTKMKQVTDEEYCSDDENEDKFEDESLSAAIRYQQELREGEEFLQSQTTHKPCGSSGVKMKKLKKSAYFSDEEEVSD